ncbi:hypothetical protein P152DRAFT_248289 [Eremomyces bilateralis CBS 781.70]|uniref:Homeobox domain-containing protein n=1 Tax=Eremomyces bilateralis CBS 781.70 TaxID=1392243 RepID=A0A6G1GAY2_9PEZI|nr:uncharacterized protein P152DRAFT_248289 [Eremomyces bilateralis CBS 781.70]KAF1815193.1 hypothetical protein P152DRAFT_248289 [Eremomyces bilateralis CBS 781.70]
MQESSIAMVQPSDGAKALSASPASTAVSTHTPGSAPRRPPRKSTLTQQQKNQKRQRATQDQLITLEVEFNKNPTPTAMVRERIAQEINMTERSVQIWFQNRRAKIKNIAKKSIENGEDCNDIPESMRRYLALQAMESGKSLVGRDLLGRGLSYGNGLLLNTETSSSKVVIHHLHCRSLTIGSWRRVGQTAMDLVIFYSPEKRCVTYYINNDSAGYKIEYPFNAIKNISLESGDALSAEGASQRPGGLIVELNRPPNFFMDSSGSGGFYQCGDFTEEQQASQCLAHHLGGHPKVLSGQLAKLVSLESFQSRFQTFDPNGLTVSAPVSPIEHRPASQPNHFAHPHMNGFQESQFAPNLLHPGRGHKRQRSRSVPAAIDFSMIRHPMPSFLVHQQQHVPSPLHQVHPIAPNQGSPFVPPQNLFAPVPQHASPSPFPNAGFGPPLQNHHPQGPPNGLSIDTTAASPMGQYSMDMRAYPMTATTAPSPSEFGTPGFFPVSGPPGPDAMQTAPFNQPFSGPPQNPQPIPAQVMTPMNEPTMHHTPLPDSTPQTTSISPMAGVSQPVQPPQEQQSQPYGVSNPVIATHSPPLGALGRSASADFLVGALPEDGSGLQEENFLSNDFFGSKGQGVTLPIRSPFIGHNSPFSANDGNYSSGMGDDDGLMMGLGEPLDDGVPGFWGDGDN